MPKEQDKDTQTQSVPDSTNPGSQITKLAPGPQGRPIAANNNPTKESELMGYLD
ncbi:hypothetical protein [Laspinema olomoucense]|uniref:Uncharacterized protein n=1 Tax=Laspinema olomoucense D3b TaxID=2953688 RepID=A0ABT2N0S9_9CYAN|nr:MULTISPECIES: hypothetical protein [unclassified Laspinema]MCT7970898.1 hypothetical protein [Laspinema sp. D3d]MCT7976282.1 hypothetical protein [Laspinema sp. D3b]MCT7991001.1 hypothetical protein [Laspinema sp. D3a]MCT7997383.1 hypothetical protein [Laspinema sp. D3c]